MRYEILGETLPVVSVIWNLEKKWSQKVEECLGCLQI